MTSHNSTFPAGFDMDFAPRSPGTGLPPLSRFPGAYSEEQKPNTSQSLRPWKASETAEGTCR